MLVIAPHPDDETLGAGGLIAAERSRGVDVTVAAVTDGENAYTGVPDLAERRRREQLCALRHLGVENEKVFRFDLPDGGVESREEELLERLLPLVSEATHVVAPWEWDFHADHKACGRAAKRAANMRGASLTWYFFWTWHFGEVKQLAGLALRRFALTPELLHLKAKALSCHRTQLVREDGGAEAVLPGRLLGPARRPFEIFAAA